ncbi:MAG: ornithine cyclodeaminase family protein [Acidobacteria bacterium]|nr:ornithine cyclodeaminase family protein [Acidobacteriota bacterium]
MVLILSEKEVASVLTMSEAIDVIEEAFRQHSLGSTAMPSRIGLSLPSEAGSFRVMVASLPEAGAFGLKTLSGIPGRRDPSQTYFLVLLFDSRTGALLSVMAAGYLTAIRTGAASGVATKYLARKEARILGIIGAGIQAKTQVWAAKTVRPIQQVKVFDVDRARCSSFVDEIRRELGVEARAAQTPQETVEGSDIVAAATTSQEPVFRAEWLPAGVHINAVGANSPNKREVDPATFRKAKIVLDFQEQVLQEAGDVISALSSGALSRADLYAELGEIVAGKKKGRTDDAEITLFKSVGVAIEDVATAALVYRRAKERGIGTSVELA